MKYFSLFSGIGGFEIGIGKVYQGLGRTKQAMAKRRNSGNTTSRRIEEEKQGVSCVGYSETDKYAEAIYRYHYPEHKNFGDATRIVPEEIPDFDLLIAGFPCQSFSIAGKRKGFEDTRGTLFYEIARIASVKRPELLLLENVKGLLSHDNGKTFGFILSTLSDLGYICEWQVLNSKDYGVPQNRERAFIIGHLGGISGQAVFPIGEDGEGNNETQGRASEQGERVRGDFASVDSRTGSTARGQHLIHNVYGGFGEKKPREFKDYSPTIRTPKGGGHLPVVACLTPDRAEKCQHGRRMKGDGEPMFTLTGQDIHGIAQGTRIRRLTPTECERLQAFPDDWTKWGMIDGKKVKISDTQRYKCLGNAVTSNVVAEIMKRILEF